MIVFSSTSTYEIPIIWSYTLGCSNLWIISYFFVYPIKHNSSFLPIKIHHFGPVSFSVVDEVSNLTIAICLWYLPHRQFRRIGKPV